MRAMARQTRSFATISYALVACAALSVVGVQVLNPPPAPGIVVSGTAPGGVHSSLRMSASGPAAQSEPTTLVADYLWTYALGTPATTLSTYFINPAASRPATEAPILIFDESEPPRYSDDGQGTVTVSVAPIGSIDAEGYFTDVGASSTMSFKVQVQRDPKQQWRLAAPPSIASGIISLSEYLATHTRRDATFVSQPLGNFVAVNRWVPGSAQAADLIALLIRGPGSRYPNLATALKGVSLGSPVVTRNGVTTVDLRAPQPLPAARIDTVKRQIMATLAPVLPGQQVRLLVNGVGSTLALPANGIPETGINGVNSKASVVALNASNRLVQLLGMGSRQQVVNIEAFAGKTVNSFTTGMRGAAVAILTDDTRTLIGWTGLGTATSFKVSSTVASLRPSIDDFGWFWLPSVNNAGTLVAASSQTNVASVASPELAGKNLIAAEVSPDGMNFMAVVGDEKQQTLWVAPVIRDADGKPLRLGVLRELGANLTSIKGATWAGGVAIAIAGESVHVRADESGRFNDGITVRNGAGPRAFVVSLDGPTFVIPGITGVESLAVNLSSREAYASTTVGRSLYFVGGRWTVVEPSFSQPKFSF